MADPNGVRKLLRREPFVPFRLVATSGSAYEIRDPKLVVVMNREVFIAHADLDRHGLVPCFTSPPSTSSMGRMEPVRRAGGGAGDRSYCDVGGF